MSKERTIIIGDVHGCYTELKELLNLLSWNKSQDTLIFVGDLINRGPDSLSVIKFAQDSEASVVMGNHEWGFMTAMTDRSLYSKNFEKLKKHFGSELEPTIQWMRQLPFYIDEYDFIVVHAGIIPSVKISEIPLKILLTIRTWDGRGLDLENAHNPPWYELYHDKKLIVFGHWAAKGVIVRDNAIGLDSGCVWGGKLSALCLPERKIYQVSAHKKYV